MSILSDFRPRHQYLVGIDSDGCAFDTMELKHKECFIPNTINYYELQGVSKYAAAKRRNSSICTPRAGASTASRPSSRPCNGCGSGPRCRLAEVEISIPQGLMDWIKRETKLGNPALKEAVAATPDPDLRRALDWSVAVNQTVTDIVRGVPPFPFVRECLEELQQYADILVVSATPQEALEREWAEHDLTRYVVAICGQEMGTKKEAFALAKRYQPGQVLMVGNATG